MQQKIILQIPTPCHENWNNMDAASQNQPGKFCDNCQKNVVDFTNMSDAEVLAYFSTNKNNTCGRFENDQLNRVLATQPPPKKSWYKWMMAALVSGFIFSNKAKAQVRGKVGEVQTCQKKPILLQTMGGTAQNQRIVLGGVSAVHESPKYILEGTVKDEKGNFVAAASVRIKGSKIGAVTNKEGKYSIYNEMVMNNQLLVVGYVGYNPVEQSIDLPKQIVKVDIVRNEIHIQLKPIVLLQENIAFMGDVVVISKPKKANRVIDTLKNILPKLTLLTAEKLVVAPNPAKAGNPINLTVGKAGEYQVQLFNLQSIMLYNQKVAVATDNTKMPFSLPASIAQGEYIISATNQQSKSKSTGKLIVQ